MKNVLFFVIILIFGVNIDSFALEIIPLITKAT